MIARLYQDHYNEILRFVTSLSRDKPLAEDLTQETFMRALKHAVVFQDLNPSECRAWLYRTARNLFIDRMRQAQKEKQLTLTQTTQAEDLSQIDVTEALAQLPVFEQTLFRMRYFEGYNASELGQRFGLAPSTVRAKLMAARRKLREQQQRDERKD